MKKKDVLMVAHFTQIEGEKGNGRFLYIANKLNYEKIELEIVTTRFSHRTKEYRKVDNKITPYKLTMIDEPKYKKNVSLRRFYSHYIFSKNIKKYLEKRKKPDVIYCTVPSLDCAYETARYAEKNDIKLILDIQDIWPEAFELIFKIPVLSDVMYYPMKRKAEKIYSLADEIIAVSKTYADLAIKKNIKIKKANIIFLGTELNKFDEFTKGYEKFKEKFFTIVYIGTLGHSYNIKGIVDAIEYLEKKGIEDIKFLVMGDGPLKEEFEKYTKSKIKNCEFTGRIDYKDMVRRLRASDIAVNPIMNGASQSITNKIGDYSAAGLPVVSTQECLEYQEIINNEEIGINCINKKIEDIADAIFDFYSNLEKKVKFGDNNREFAKQKFDRGVTYKKIIDLICTIEK